MLKIKIWLAAIAGAFIAGLIIMRKIYINKEVRDYVKTRKKLDKVGRPLDVDAARDRLRKRKSSGIL